MDLSKTVHTDTLFMEGKPFVLINQVTRLCQLCDFVASASLAPSAVLLPLVPFATNTTRVLFVFETQCIRCFGGPVSVSNDSLCVYLCVYVCVSSSQHPYPLSLSLSLSVPVVITARKRKLQAVANDTSHSPYVSSYNFSYYILRLKLQIECFCCSHASLGWIKLLHTWLLQFEFTSVRVKALLHNYWCIQVEVEVVDCTLFTLFGTSFRL